MFNSTSLVEDFTKGVLFSLQKLSERGIQFTLFNNIGACVCDVVQTVIPVGSLGQQTKEHRLEMTSPYKIKLFTVKISNIVLKC